MTRSKCYKIWETLVVVSIIVGIPLGWIGPGSAALKRKTDVLERRLALVEWYEPKEESGSYRGFMVQGHQDYFWSGQVSDTQVTLVKADCTLTNTAPQEIAGSCEGDEVKSFTVASSAFQDHSDEGRLILRTHREGGVRLTWLDSRRPHGMIEQWEGCPSGESHFWGLTTSATTRGTAHKRLVPSSEDAIVVSFVGTLVGASDCGSLQQSPSLSGPHVTPLQAFSEVAPVPRNRGKTTQFLESR